MKLFKLVREHDESGVSGTGVVAEGVIFSSGRVAMTWLTHLTSVAYYDNLEALESIHGHKGSTKVIIYFNDSGLEIKPLDTSPQEPKKKTKKKSSK